MMPRRQVQSSSGQSRQFRVCAREGKPAKAPLPEVELAELIQWIRGEKVILDRDLARLYQVEVKALNQAVKRNSSRFPGDFMFQLTAVEAEFLRSQFVTLDGVEAVASSAQARGKQAKYDEQFKVVFDAIRQLMLPVPQSKRRIGFAPWDDKT